MNPDIDLLNAAWYGNITWVEFLLTCDDVDINTGIHALGKTPLFVACERGHSSVVKVLLKYPEIDINKGSYQDVC